jgi:hypothetical protein
MMRRVTEDIHRSKFLYRNLIILSTALSTDVCWCVSNERTLLKELCKESKMFCLWRHSLQTRAPPFPLKPSIRRSVKESIRSYGSLSI